MKSVILVLGIALLSGAAQASCKGGRKASFCHQLSAVSSGQVPLSATFGRQIDNQLALTQNERPNDILETADCSVDLFKIRNNMPTVCRSENYSYTFVDSITTAIGSRDPYFIGAQMLVKSSVHSRFGLVVENLANGEKEVLGCETFILCPK